MSDLAAAAAAMGVPEALVKRSAQARAQATGASVEEILAAWAGGGETPGTMDAPGASAAPATPEHASPKTPEAGEEPAVTSQATGPQLSPPTSEPGLGGALRPASSESAPPILVGERQGVGVVVTASLGLLILSLLLSVFLPSMPQPGSGIRSSNHAFSSQARAGQSIYASQGCVTCHTQVIRNVVADVGLGPVTLDDTNQIVGYRRIGPDLSAIGSRIEDTSDLIALMSGAGDHPAASGLSEGDLASLVAYLRESR